jgi:hypothetical protein
MGHYSEKISNKDKQFVKDFIMDKISHKIDEALANLESAYDYNHFCNEIWIDSFHGSFKLHFTPANEMNDGQNYYLSFDYFGRGK